MKRLSFGRTAKHETAQGHNLTSLVDCFAIILIYLLMATSFGELDLEIPKDMKLPKAASTSPLTESTVVLVKDNSYVIAGREIRLENLAEEFKRIFEARKLHSNDKEKSEAIVIQADRKMTYGEINPVVLAGLLAGFSEVQFAVLKDEMAAKGESTESL